jgi:hypothetical protein
MFRTVKGKAGREQREKANQEIERKYHENSRAIFGELLRIRNWKNQLWG